MYCVRMLAVVAVAVQECKIQHFALRFYFDLVQNIRPQLWVAASVWTRLRHASAIVMVAVAVQEWHVDCVLSQFRLVTAVPHSETRIYLSPTSSLLSSSGNDNHGLATMSSTGIMKSLVKYVPGSVS